ncbi:MAG: GNAT family N-acetyltransferase [Candidatus Abawacabacteria bacterium]|nr:GNAT family N-acetyltransferase [Candidatus Abawacabacteria bacterium]
MTIHKITIEDATGLLTYFQTLVAVDTKRVERPEDVAKITLENEKAWISSRIDDEAQKEMFVLCLKDEQGNIVAEGEVERKKRWIERHIAEIRFGVLPGYESKAKSMVEQLLNTAQQNGLETLFYFHLKTQTQGINIMKALGFKEIGTIEKYYKLNDKKYIDRVYLSKNIQKDAT